MTCFNTITAWQETHADGSTEIHFNKRCGKELQLPCGKCIGCQLDKANDWATRCYLEALGWQNNCFITLTYDNKHLPKNELLNKSHLQKFMKRLRYYHTGIEKWNNPRNGKEEYPIRFLACGEYGPSETGTHRPHYHILLFNWKPKNLEFYKRNKDGQIIYKCKEIQKIWGKGFITVEDFNYRTACYVARYTTKKLFGKESRAVAIKNHIQPEFIDMSRNGGIGIRYWNEYQEKILKQDGIILNAGGKVKHRQIPKYFERKYKEQNETEFKKYQEYKIEKAKKTIAKILKETSLTESEYKRMQERTLLEKAKTLRRDNFI